LNFFLFSLGTFQIWEHPRKYVYPSGTSREHRKVTMQLAEKSDVVLLLRRKVVAAG
jgi:hypothetical protein